MTQDIGDWWKGNSKNRYSLRHRVRLLFGIHGQMCSGEYLFDYPKSWKYPRFNKFLNKIINLIPSI